jgi:hypothetical protein
VTVHDINDHMAYTCRCGSVHFNLLRSGRTECAGCGERAGQPRHNGGMPKTSKEKQEDFRARQAMLGLKEVRGIFLPEALHASLKEHAAKLLRAYKPKEKE